MTDPRYTVVYFWLVFIGFCGYMAFGERVLPNVLVTAQVVWERVAGWWR